METSLSNLTRVKLDETLNQIQRKASSILTLTVQWKQVEDHFNLLGKSMDDRCKELKLLEACIKKREDKLLEQEETLKERFEELEAREEELELQSRSNVSRKELETTGNLIHELELARAYFENQITELGLKEERFLATKKLIEDRYEELHEKERQVEKREEELKVKEKDSEQNSKMTRQRCNRARSRVQDLIKKGLRLDAVELICELNMVGVFSPASILLEHLGFLERNAELSKQNGSTRMKAIETEISGLRAIARCVENYKLEAGFPLVKLEERIAGLEKEKEVLERSGPRTRSKSRLLEEPDEERFNTAVQQGTRNKRKRVV